MKIADRFERHALPPSETDLTGVLDEYVAALRRGERPSKEELLRVHPIAGELSGCLNTLDVLEGCAEFDASADLCATGSASDSGANAGLFSSVRASRTLGDFRRTGPSVLTALGNHHVGKRTIEFGETAANIVKGNRGIAFLATPLQCIFVKPVFGGGRFHSYAHALVIRRVERLERPKKAILNDGVNGLFHIAIVPQRPNLGRVVKHGFPLL